MNCDVLVLGGGGAGLAAAVAAARSGARTVLIERHGSLGGMATAALVHSICGLYLLNDGPEAIPAHRGLPVEFSARLIRSGASGGPVRLGRMDVLPHSPPGFACVADDLTAGCASLDVRLHTELIGVVGNGKIEAVEVICRGRRATISPRAVVDASGDAMLVDLAGAATDQAPEDRLQRPAFIFALHSVNVAALGDDARIRLAHQMADAVRSGRLDAGCLGAQVRSTGRGSEVFITIDLAATPDYDPLAQTQLATLERAGRQLASQLAAFLAAEHPAFSGSAISAFPSRVGVRESRGVRGQATITGSDVLHGTAVPDEVARGTWPIELRERATGPRWRFPEGNRPTPIPLRALRASALENLWAAGRCLSCDHEAQAALRVIGTCLATGQAAGIAVRSSGQRSRRERANGVSEDYRSARPGGGTMELNVAALIAERAARAPEQPALISGAETWSYSQLLARADAVASRLRELLAGEFCRTPVPRVGLYCPNSAEYVALALGILRAGACLVPVPSELAVPERNELIRLTAQHLVVAAGPRPWLPDTGTDEETNGIAWSWTRSVAQPQFPEDRFAALSPAFVRFSSGTTGSSKGVVLSHASLLARVRSANRRLQITADDRVLWTLPMAHHFAVSIVLYLLEGATTVLEDSHLAADVLATARKTCATVMYGSPFHYQLLAADETSQDWPTLRLAVSTAAPLKMETSLAFHRRYDVPLTQGLGIIEVGLPLLNTDAPLAHPLSVGRADDFEVTIREDGELWLRGPGMFDAYLLPWREKADVTTEGWFATGDVATCGPDGRIFLQGRCKAVINVGGMKFFPEEVEAVLDAHPAILESRVSGEPHDRWGMIPVAEIVPRNTAEPPTTLVLSRHCREHLASYKAPQRVSCVAKLPRTATGKLKR